MKISIIGGGNMGGAIARGLVNSRYCSPESIYVINRRRAKADEMKALNAAIHTPVNDCSSVADSDVVIIALKPWLVENWIRENRASLQSERQLFISVAAGITPTRLSKWIGIRKPIYCVIPNTAIEVMQSMTYITSLYSDSEYDNLVTDIFSRMGKAQIIDERMLPAAMSLCSCGIAFAFRYIRAAMEGGVEMGLYPNMAKEGVLQTLKGAVALLEATGSHPEAEVDKVTTAGGLTIKGLNEMEHAGFSSAVIKGLKASKVESK